MDHMNPYPWTIVTVTEHLRTGTYKPGSMRITRSATPPPPAKEEGTAVERFSGPPTRIRVLRGEAGTSWSTETGTVIEVPRGHAEFLIGKKNARLARADEPLTFAPIE